jgi:cysteinyl-tRNA synthetase
MDVRKYYAAYDERYKTVHAQGVSWASEVSTPIVMEVIEKYRKDFIDAVNDDINIPLSLGVIWTMLKETPSKDIYALALEFDKVLGLSLNKAKPAEKEKIEVPDSIKAIADERWQARLAKNWAESDRLRDELANLGYLVKDAKDGYTLEKK